MPIVPVLCLIFCFVSIVCGNEYENSENLQILSLHHETPRLEDFFWTGSGDGPPPPPDPVSLPEEPSTPIIRTTTILATVYLDSYPPQNLQAVTDKTTGECVLNCGEPTAPDSLESEIPEDRRYWLLTVIQGSTPDSLQLKLARLYQKAFLRQQERHLGIIKSLDAPTPRKKHEVHSFVVNKDNNYNQIVPFSSNTNTPLKYLDIESSIVNMADLEPTSISQEDISATVSLQDTSDMTITKYFPDNMQFAQTILPDEQSLEISATTVRGTEWILATPTIPEPVLKKREVTDEKTTDENERLIDIPLEDANETLLFKREIIKPEQQPPVQVHIQNITETPDTGSIQIVYVVMVGGRAVPAAVAARDMRLVRDAEVAKELGAVVTTKAEPYLKAAEGLEGEAVTTSVSVTEMWALAVGGTVGVLILIILLILLCLAHRRKSIKSAASLRAYRNELMREIERTQMKQVHEEKDGRLISVVSPSRTRPSSTLLPIYRTASASGSSTTSSEVTEIPTVRRRPKKPHALRMPQKKRVGTTDSLLEAAGVESSDSCQASGPHTPTSYLSMPSVTSFPRGNLVEPLSKILEPVSVRHLDIDSPVASLKNQDKHTGQDRPISQGRDKEVVPRRQMTSQLVRLGSIDKDPGVIGPLVWDLHCQRIKDNTSKPSTPSKSLASIHKEPSRMRQRFNELMDDAFTLFGSTSSPDDQRTRKEPVVTQARNDNVRLPGSPYTALDTLRGKSAGPSRDQSTADIENRPRTSAPKPRLQRGPPAKAWGSTPPHSFTRLPPGPAVNPAFILAEGKLPAEDPALPLISAIKSEIQRVRENAQKKN